MPLYDYRCPSCEVVFERQVPLAAYLSPQHCDKCGDLAEKVLSPVRVVGDYPGYECPVTGRWVEGRKAHSENLKRTGCRVLEPGEKENAQSMRLREEREFERKLDATAEEFVEKLPAQAKQRLVAEMEAGITATVQRQ